MNTKTISVAATVLLSLVAQAQPMRVLVTHEVPTKEQLVLISVDEGKLAQLAKDLDFEVVVDGVDTLVFDADLYNCRMFDRCLKGLDAVSRMLSTGKREFKLGDLSASEKEGLRNLLTFSGYGAELGPALFDDKTSMSLGMTWNVQLEANARKANGYIHKLPDKPQESEANFTDEEFKDFVKNELPKHKIKKHDVNQLVVRTAVGWVTSSRRTEAIAKLMEIFTKRMKLQAKAYNDKQAVLVNAFGGADNIKSGMMSRALTGNDRTYLESSLLGVGGFKDKFSANSFMDGAKIIGATPTVRIGIYYNIDNKPSGVSTQLTIHRGN